MQGDRFGVIVEAAVGPMVLAHQAGARHRDRVRLALAPLRPAGEAQWERDVAIFGERIGAHDLILVLTDGFDEPCVATVERLAASGRDVALIQILTADERDFPFAQGYHFHDPETGKEIVGDGRTLRADFIARFAEARPRSRRPAGRARGPPRPAFRRSQRRRADPRPVSRDRPAMSPALLLPLGLAALAALAIPIVIHIARRSESRTIDFAALRWLSQKAKPRRSVQIDERWLLAIRLALLVMIALILAKPVLWGVHDKHPVIAILPGVDATAALTDADAKARRVFAPYPAVGGVAPSAPADPFSLIRQLDAELDPDASLEILVPTMLDGVDTERPVLSRRVDWRVVATSPVASTTRPTQPPALTVRYSTPSQGKVRWFRAAATAWAEPGAQPKFDVALTDRPIGREARYLIWLAEGDLPDPVVRWIRSGGTAVLSHDAQAPLDGDATTPWRDEAGEPLMLAGRLGRGRVIFLTRALEPSAMPQLLEPDFPDQLLRRLTPAPPPSRVASAAIAPLTGATAYPQQPLDLRPWLALIAALLFGAERLMATRRSRMVSP